MIDNFMDKTPFQRGFRIDDYVLRASKVVISSGAPEAAETINETPAETDA